MIDDHAGVCSGVRRAIEIADKQLAEGSQLVALGHLIHNDVEMDRLARKGLHTVDQDGMSTGKIHIEEINDKQLLIRTHGVGVDLRSKLLDAGIELIDATCPTVRHVQKLIEKYFSDGYQIVIVGKKSHPEVQGLQGHCQNMAIVISSMKDLSGIDYHRKTFLVAQTTASPAVFFDVYNKIKGKIADLVVKDTTCNIINRRHQYIRDFAASCDVILFVGGKQSSNTRVLSEICRSVNPRTFRIESPTDINHEWFKESEKIGISGGASTPTWQLHEVKDYLENNAK